MVCDVTVDTPLTISYTTDRLEFGRVVNVFVCHYGELYGETIRNYKECIIICRKEMGFHQE